MDTSKYSDRADAVPERATGSTRARWSRSTFTCTRTDAVVAPFVDGEWAPKDSTFVVIGLASTLTSFAVYGDAGAGATYTVASSKEKSELGGSLRRRVIEESGCWRVLAAGILVFTVQRRAAEGPRPSTGPTRSSGRAVAGDIDAPYDAQGRRRRRPAARADRPDRSAEAVQDRQRLLPGR